MTALTRFAASLPTVSLVTLSATVVPVSATAQDVTPPPTMELGDTCEAVVTYHWDVTELDHLAGVYLELKDAPFVDPDGLDDQRLWSRRDKTVGSRQIDLRSYGPVLDLHPYWFRVIGRGGGGSPPSVAVVFDRSTPPVAVQASAGTAPLEIDVAWDVPAAARGCADRVRRQVVGPDGTVVISETDDVWQGSATWAVPGPGTWQVAVAAFHGGSSPDDAVGLPGAASVEVAPAVAVQPRPPGYRPGGAAPADPPPSDYRITSLDPWSSRGPIESPVEGEVAFRFTHEGPVPQRYRIGECEELEREWRDYEPGSTPSLELGPGRRTVCLQIAALTSKNVELVSQVENRSLEILRDNPEEPMLLRVLLSTDRDRNADYAFQKEKIGVRPIVRGEATHVRFGGCDALQSESWRPWDRKTSLSTSFASTGVQELCMQVKSEPRGTVARYSGIRSREIEVFGPLVTRVITREVSNGYLQGYARGNGFSMSHNAFYGNDGSGCNIVLTGPESDLSNVGLALHPGGSTYVMCKYTLFGGRTLNPPWTVESVSAPTTDCVRTSLVRKPSKGSRSLHTTIEARPRTRACASRYSLGIPMEITLIGPRGANWREAFRRR